MALGEPARGRGGQDAELYLGDRRISCVVCDGTRFDYREVLMNTSGLTFLDLDWANKSATGAVCRGCGYVHTFMGDRVEWRAPGDPTPEWMRSDGR